MLHRCQLARRRAQPLAVPLTTRIEIVLILACVAGFVVAAAASLDVLVGHAVN
jgi:hypothetical protein